MQNYRKIVVIFFVLFAYKSFADLTNPANNAFDSLTHGSTNESTGHWGMAAEGFRLGIHTTKQTFTMGEQVAVDALLQNTTATNLSIANERASGPGGAFYDGYGIVLLNGTNQLPSLVKRRTDPFSPDVFSGSSSLFEAAPGDIYHHTIFADREFDLKSAGTYSVYVTTRVRKLQSKGSTEIKSEIITFQIVGDSQSAN